MVVRRTFMLLLVLAACVSTDEPPEGGRAVAPTADADGRPIVPVIVITALDGDATATTYLEGFRLAIREINRDGGIGGAAIRSTLVEASEPSALAGALRDSVASFVVGPGSIVAASRAEVERDGDPVLLMGGDLYSSRQLFRQVFQVTPPLRWQAEALARYLVLDRRHDDVALVTGPPPDGRSDYGSFLAAMQEESSNVGAWFNFQEGGSTRRVLSAARAVDATAFLGTTESLPFFTSQLRSEGDVAVFAASSTGLPVDGDLPVGTVLSYLYTWAPWADPIPRVHAFRERFGRVFGRPPVGFEQEGYDAGRLLADALRGTDGRGGPALIAALEGTSDVTYSSLPIALGPDDHLVAGRGQIGIFVRLAPGEIDERTSPTGVPWSPIMRTFTYNGLRTSVVDDDKRVFFPAWRKKAPAPAYPRSRLGITTGRDDPAH